MGVLYEIQEAFRNGTLRINTNPKHRPARLLPRRFPRIFTIKLFSARVTEESCEDEDDDKAKTMRDNGAVHFPPRRYIGGTGCGLDGDGGSPRGPLLTPLL